MQPAASDFEAAALELAAQRRALVERFGFVLVCTIRVDGTSADLPGRSAPDY
jgi:hypothetical protein